MAGGGERLPGRRKAEAARAGDVVADDVLAHGTITFIACCAAALSNYNSSDPQALASSAAGASKVVAGSGSWGLIWW